MVTLSNSADLTSETIVTAALAYQPPHSDRSTTDQVNRSISDCNDLDKTLPHLPPVEPPIRRTQSSGSNKPTNSSAITRLNVLPDFGDPLERAKRREEAHLRQIAAEEAAAKEENVRQMRIKREKAEILRRHEEEERQRRDSLEQELLLAAKLKAEKAEDERIAAEQKALQRDLKKRKDAEKRMADSQRIEAWRVAEQRRIDELAQQEQDALRMAEEAKQSSRISALRVRKECLSSDGVLLKGWTTVQNPSSLVWRRRWFELTATGMLFYKNDKVSSAIDHRRLTFHES